MNFKVLKYKSNTLHLCCDLTHPVQAICTRCACVSVVTTLPECVMSLFGPIKPHKQKEFTLSEPSDTGLWSAALWLTLPQYQLTLDTIVLFSCREKDLNTLSESRSLSSAMAHGCLDGAAQCGIVEAATGLISCATSWLSDLRAPSDWWLTSGSKAGVSNYLL